MDARSHVRCGEAAVGDVLTSVSDARDSPWLRRTVCTSARSKETPVKTRHIWTAAVAMTIAFRVGVAAQSTGAPATTIQQSKNVTVRGCLQQVDPPASSPTGSARPGARPSISNPSKSASSSANRFMLTGATSNGASAAKRDPSSASGGTYVLEGQTADLRLHVNHQVEINGHVSSAYTSAGSSGAGGSRLNVSSVRTISANCAR